VRAKNKSNSTAKVPAGTVLTAFEAVAQRAPRATAVVDDEGTLTYAELDRASASLARALLAAGVTPGARVVLSLGRSREVIVALLAILRAGAAYVPIEASYPATRRELLVRDAAPALILTHASTHALFESLGPCLRVDGGLPSAPSEAGARLPIVGPEDPAYILYTSGSTGVPKGVVHTHGSGLAFTRWVIRRFDVRADDVFSSHAPFHFDLSISDLYASLGSGGTVRLISSLEGMLAPWLARQIDDWGITVWYSVPSILVSMLETGLLTAPAWPRLRLLLFAGEVFPTPQLRRLRRAVPGAGLYNLFGPTETNVCTYYEVPAEIPDGQTEPIPIGRTCEHLETFVLDDAGSVAAPGAEGTLWARGANLMLGYWNDPQRTAATLQADPRGGPGLAYCTGDRVVQQEDGEYRFRGRRDHQVKIRGYRIELGDVEAALAAHADVLEAVALPLEREGTAARLVATVVARAGSEPSPDELRDHSRRHLPAYMVPERIEVAPALPRTSSGKADRTALRSAWESKGDAWI